MLVVPHPSLPLAPSREIEEGDGFDIDTSFNSQYGILVELEDTFSEEQSFDESSDVEFSDVTPPDVLRDPISFESYLNLALTPPTSSSSSRLPIFLPSLM